MKPNAPAASLDVAKASAGLSLETEETALAGELPAPESKRRRLVGGAVALAPLVLTLRSGGVAAASCTGATLVTIGQNGKFTYDNPQDRDVCISDTPAPVCSGYPTTPGRSKVETEPATLARVVRENGNGQVAYRCDTQVDLRGKTVAILSSASATSLISG